MSAVCPFSVWRRPIFVKLSSDESFYFSECRVIAYVDRPNSQWLMS
ncbi:hypothetical protein BCEP27_100216 [Burkholderia cepacia]